MSPTAGGRRAAHPVSRTASRVATSSMLTVVVGVLCVVGLVMVGSASSVISLDLYGSPWAIFIRQIIWMAVGAVAFAFACRFDYRRWRPIAPAFLVVTFLLLFAVLLPGIGVNSGGSSRWIGFGQLRLQPSEMMKLALVLFGADLVVRRLERGGSYRSIAGPLVLVTSAAGLLIIAQPDMGTALVIACIALALLFGSGAPMKPVLKVLGALGVLALIVGVADPYRRARLLSFLNPSAHQSGSGYQVVQSLIGLGSGHLFGLGLGSGRQKWGLLPNAHTDFIFSVIGEELGLFGALAVLCLFGALAWFGLRAAERAPDRFGRLVAMSLVVWITTETAINVGAVIGLLPVTGIPLPFVSFGGSSLVITLVAAGILVNIARHERTAAPGLRLVGDQRRHATRPGTQGGRVRSREPDARHRLAGAGSGRSPGRPR
jgi:cell division protein FtsW